MDWSSVYEDEGEGVGDWTRDDSEQASRTGMLMSLSGYSPFICYAFTVNYILGVGCLGIPYAFLQSGVLLGSLMVLLLSFVSYMTCMWIAVATQQEVSISLYLTTSNPFLLSPYSSLAKRKKAVQHQLTAFGEQTALLPQLASHPSYANISAIEKEMASTSRKRKDNTHKDVQPLKELEVTDLAAEFLGPAGRLTYQASLTALTFVGLMAYSQVFMDTMTQQLLPSASYALALPLLFALIVVPLSCMDLAEQVHVQVAMSALRFLALGILLLGTTVALFLRTSSDTLPSSSIASLHPQQPLPLMRWQGLGCVLTTAIFSQLFQHSVPGLIRPLSPEDKKQVPAIFRAALATTSLLYIAIGCTAVSYFGDSLEQSVNLNFIGFDWGTGSGIAQALAMIVVLFPALDTLSVFPLIAITLGNNLHAACPWLDQLLYQGGAGAGDKATVRKMTRIFWRLVASIPPIVGSIFVHDLVVSLQVAGLCGIFVALITPALLHQQTAHRMALIPPSMQTTMPLLFPDAFNRAVYVQLVIALGVVAMAIALGQMIM